MKRVFYAALFFSIGAFGVEVHVSPRGDDGAAGDKKHPVSTLEAARALVRARPAGEGATVWLADGRYERSASFELTKEDSGSAGAPVVYRAVHPGKARVCGSVQLPTSGWKRVDATAKKRLDPAVVGHVRMLDLKACGLTDYGKMLPRGFSTPVWPIEMELFADGKRMTLARWPQREGDTIYSGKVKYGKVNQVGTRSRLGETGDVPGKIVFENARVQRWAGVAGAWLHGVWAYDWADRRVRLLDVDVDSHELTVGHSHYGFKPNKPFYIVNLLEELDVPGEYYIDRDAGRLYFYPPATQGELTVSIVAEPLIVLEDASHVILKDLVIEEGRSIGVAISGGAHNRVKGCTLRNLGTAAINVGEGERGREIYNIGYGGGMEGLYARTAWNRNAGVDQGIEDCHIHDIGAYGILLGGGDRKTLTPAGNFVVNCDIHHVARIYEQMFSNIHVDGVGNRVAFNRLRWNPHSVLMFWGNDHLIEYNEMSHCVYDSSDSGAVYTGRDPSQTGSTIRWNYFHHIKGHEDYEGIFFDDGASGLFVYGNIFHDIQSEGSTKYHGGQYNTYANNIVVDCSRPVEYQLWDQAKWQSSLEGELWQERLLNAVNILEDPYATKYPSLARVFDTPYARASHIEERNLVTSADDPLFENGAAGDFRIRDWDALRKRIPGFQIIPIERIGLKGGERPLLAPSFTSINKRLFPGQELVIKPAKADEDRGEIAIHYTLDGSDPSPSSPRYSKPLLMDQPRTVKARAYLLGDSELPGSGVGLRVCEPAVGTIYLDELAAAEFSAHNGLKINHNYSYTGHVQFLDDIYEHSIMACPVAKERQAYVIYDLSIFPGEKIFEAYVGIDRLIARMGSSAFKLYGEEEDGTWKRLAETPVLRSGGAARKLTADITPYQRIKLFADDGGDGTGGDHAAWGNAAVIIKP